MKVFNRAVLAACMFTAVGTASATAFSVTDAAFTAGSGYGIDAAETVATATLLDVRFLTAGFALQNFTLTTVGDFYDFTVGSVNFQEPNGLQGIVTAETNNLSVALALNFAAPGNVTNSLLATGTAVVGSVSDGAVDYTLSWAPLTATFGTGGMYSITMATMSFTNIGAKNLVARVTLTGASATAAAIPEPGSVALLAIGLFGAGMLRRRASK